MYDKKDNFWKSTDYIRHPILSLWVRLQVTLDIRPEFFLKVIEFGTRTVFYFKIILAQYTGNKGYFLTKISLVTDSQIHLVAKNARIGDLSCGISIDILLEECVHCGTDHVYT